MSKLCYEEFVKIINNYDCFDNKVLKAMYQEFGREKIDEYFEIYYQSLKGIQAEEFLKKYYVYFEQQVSDYNCINDFFNGEIDSIVGVILRKIEKFPIMSPEFEYEQGLILDEGRKNLNIIESDIDNYRLCPRLNLEKIILSVNNFEHLRIIEQILKIPYILQDDSVFKNEIEILKKYIKKCYDNNEIMNLEQLKIQFPKLCFDDVLVVEDLSYQVELLKKYLFAKYNFYNRNLRLIIAFAKKGGNQLSFEDKIQEANIGLIKAISKFDVSKGSKFATYAILWIKQNINRAIADKGYMIRKPAYLCDNIKRYEYFIQNYELINGIKPTLEEIANALNISLQEALELKKYCLDVLYLEAPISNVEEEVTMIEFIKDDNVLIEDDIVANDMASNILEVINKCLSEREKKIFMLRNGLNSANKCYSLHEVAVVENVSRERIRQIELKAREKIIGVLKYKKLIIND